MNDSDEMFSADVAENHEVLTKSTVSKIFERFTATLQPHPDIFSTLDKILSTAAKERLKKTSAEHMECVKQWLSSTKPLTFS